MATRSLAARLIGAALIVGFLVGIGAPGERSRVYARDLSSRLRNAAPTETANTQPAHPAQPPPVDAATAVQDLILSQTSPMAADGAGRLLLLESAGDGYGILARQSQTSEAFDMIYRRKGAWASSLAVGPDGTFCVGLNSGIDCVDAQGIVTHLDHDLLSNVISIAFTPTGDLWALTSKSGGATGLQLVYVTRDVSSRTFSGTKRVLTMRQDVRGFIGNGLAATVDGSAIVPVIENDIYRLLRVEPTGRFTRIADFFDFSGGIVTDGSGYAYIDGVKRPQSAQEQRNPRDILLTQPVGEGVPGPTVAALFPQSPSETHLTGHMALGGDGSLYVTRRERLRLDDGPAREMPVLWRIDLGRPSIIGSEARVIDFRIPFIDTVSNPMISELDYAGPVLVGRDQPLVIRGINFTGKDGVASVVIGGSPAPIQLWTEEFIAVTIPTNALGGDALVQVAIDHVRSNGEWIQVKTPEIPGWFQIGTPAIRATLQNNLSIIGYNAHITIEGSTDQGEMFHRREMMETPGLFHMRLPNGKYHATFSAAYLIMNVQYDAGGGYAGSSQVPVIVPTQSLDFQISDQEPVVVWVPDMFSRETERETP